MGGITLVDNPPDEPEGRYLLPNGHCNSSLIKDLNMLNFGPSSTPSSTFDIDDISINSQSTLSTAQTFSLSDYLVPLQTKAWGEDWEVADDFTAFDTQTFSDNNALPFQLGFDSFTGDSPIWENDVIPVDQAYDELVFDLAPTAFDSPTTVNVADLIVGPNLMTSSPSSAVVSPSDLAMTNDSTFHDIALASYYGFNASETSNSDDDLESDDDEEVSEDEDEVEHELEEVDANENIKQDVESVLGGGEYTDRVNGGVGDVVCEMQQAVPLSIDIKVDSVNSVPEKIAAPVSKLTDDPNKRRMEEDLAVRINNDLGPEHMDGLIKILMKGSTADNELEDMDEMDLSSLDEATLVQVYNYLESCCIQTVGQVIAAEQREQESQQMQSGYFDRTPALSPTHSSSSSSSPSPPHPSSIPTTMPSKSSRSKKRHEAEHQVDQDCNNWTVTTSHPYKSGGARRKRSNTVRSIKTQKDGQLHQQQQQYRYPTQGFSNCEPVVLRAASDDDHIDNDMEYGEDAEIDIVGI